MHIILILSIILLSGSPSMFRGPARDGVFPDKGLLKEWPETGPRLVWSFTPAGTGYGTVCVDGERIYLLGMQGTAGILYAIDNKGKLIWKNEYGPEWTGQYPGVRSTPVIYGDLIYFESGTGVVYCYNTSGKRVWSVDLFKKFGAAETVWGMAESILVNGDMLYCTPGGGTHNIAALNRYTGETIWTSQGNKQQSAYCSPILVRHNNSELLVTMTASSVVCIDARTGKFYWQVPQFQGNKIHANSPVYYKGHIYCASQTGEGGGLLGLRLSEDGKSVTTLWRNEQFSNLMGGVVIRDGYLYASRYQRKQWNCIDLSDGKVLYNAPGLGDGVMIWADGLFYCYSEQGEVGLVDASPEKFTVISRFKIPMGHGEHWAHPVIHNGHMYIRHGNAVMCYKIL